MLQADFAVAYWCIADDERCVRCQIRVVALLRVLHGFQVSALSYGAWVTFGTQVDVEQVCWVLNAVCYNALMVTHAFA